MIYRILIFFFILIVQPLYSVDFNKAAAELEKELNESNTQLDNARKEIFSEREKVSQDISKAKYELSKNKKSDTQLQNEIDALTKEISELENKIKINNNSVVDLMETSIQARRELEAIIPEVSSSQYSQAFKDMDESLKDKKITSFLQLYEKSQNELLNNGFKILKRQTKAVDQQGKILDATLVKLGHSHSFVMFADKAGLAEKSKHHGYPSMKEVSGTAKELKLITDYKQGLLPFDFSNGLAFKKAAKEKTLSDRFKSGGIIMYPLSLLAILCVIVGIIKTSQLFIIKSTYDDKVLKLISLVEKGELQEAHDYVNSLRDPVKSLLKDALENHNISRETLEELLNENILSQIPKLDRFMPVLSVSAGAAPLLGLLGTVMGIIKTFEMISLYGTGDPNTMAGGISEALVTTQAGLMVAIPALIWHAVLNRRVKSIVGNLEKAMLSFINALSVSKEKAQG